MKPVRSVSVAFAAAAISALSVASAAATLTTLHTFTGGADGATPKANLLYNGGYLYGTTEKGGAANDGTLFRVDPATGAEAILFSFTGKADGANPYAALIFAGGNLYGTAHAGGKYNRGCVFRFNLASGRIAILKSFSGGSDGAYPYAGLLKVGTVLYGTTYGGDSHGGFGTVFKIDPATLAFATIHNFVTSDVDGEFPVSGLVEVGGMLYGTTANGGSTNSGTIFSIDPATGAFATLYSFGFSEGANPFATMISFGGALYGTTANGGASYLGTVFKLTPPAAGQTVWTEKTLHSFSDPEGRFPSGIVYDSHALYGTTDEGGNGHGSVFKVDSISGAESSPYAFQGSSDGEYPYAGLISVGGVFYGTTQGLANNSFAGTVFKLTP